MVLALVCSAQLCASSIPVVPRAEADSLRRTVVVWNGRACPYGAMAHDVVLKLYGSTQPRGYTAEQVVASWQRDPDVWNRAPLILIKDRRIRKALGLTAGKHTSVNYLIGHRAEIQRLWDAEPNKNSKLATALLETDERAGIALMLAEGDLYEQPAPDTPQLSESRITAELLLVCTPFTTVLFIGNLVFGILVLIRALGGGPKRLSWATAANACIWLLLVASILTMCLVFGLRWYVQGYIPLTNGYETMLVWALAMQMVMAWLSAFSLRGKGGDGSVYLAFAFLLPGFFLLVAHLGEMSPQITPLMPALHSPWLSSHVSTIMIAYALLTITFILALLALLTSRSNIDRREQLTRLNRRLLWPAVVLLAAGIVLGSVWAKTAWGAYWSWDPKETWALITFIVYLLPLIVVVAGRLSQLPQWLQSSRAYNIYILCAFASVLMTYFGVNYFLGGMHSYAG